MIIGKNSKVTMSGKIITGQNLKILGDRTIGEEVGVEVRLDHGALGVEMIFYQVDIYFL